MFGKMIIALYTWYSKRVQKKYQKVQKDTKKEKEIEFYKNIQSLYKFAQWLNKQFVNRKERKRFWISVAKGEKPLENTIQQLLNHYKQRQQTEKKKEIKTNAQEKTI